MTDDRPQEETMDTVLAFAHAQREAFCKELFDYLRIPSVSGDPQFDPQTQRAAEFTSALLTRIGMEHVRLLPTAAHPVVYGDWLHAPGKPTIVIYGHYDVQPPDPLEKWTTPPFEPTIRNGHIYARGCADNKGQIAAMIYAVASWLKVGGALPLNVKFFIEGDEESGSAGMDAVAHYADLIRCDAVLISDTHWIDADHPAIFYGLKGLCYFDIAVRGANRDLHSGTFGNLMPNPLNILCHVLGQICPPNAPIHFPGFYDDVVPPAAAERELFTQVPFDERAMSKEYGVPVIGVGEPNFTHLERNWTRPTMDICGMWGGYQGAGAKTVLPSEAFAKVSFRLVPNQDPRKIAALFETYFRSLCPKGLTVTKCALLNAAEPSMTPFDDRFLRTALAALAQATGKNALIARDPASIPIAANFRKFTKAPVLLFGMGLATDDIHSPNEHFALEQFYQGIDTYIHVLGAVGKVQV